MEESKIMQRHRERTQRPEIPVTTTFTICLDTDRAYQLDDYPAASRVLAMTSLLSVEEETVEAAIEAYLNTDIVGARALLDEIFASSDVVPLLVGDVRYTVQVRRSFTATEIRHA